MFDQMSNAQKVQYYWKIFNGKYDQMMHNDKLQNEEYLHKILKDPLQKICKVLSLFLVDIILEEDV